MAMVWYTIKSSVSFENINLKVENGVCSASISIKPVVPSPHVNSEKGSSEKALFFDHVGKVNSKLLFDASFSSVCTMCFHVD